MRLSSPYLAHVGFVTTPRYFDDSPQEFLRVAPKGMGVLQRVMQLDGYTFGLDQRTAGMAEMERSAHALAESNCDVVVQIGTNWVHAAGTDPDEITAMIERISRNLGVPFLMAGMAIVDGLNALGAKTITVANSYYRSDWRDGINRFLTQAGFEILWSGNIIDQGIYSSLAELLEIEAATRWHYPPSIIRQAVVGTHQHAPEADAVVQTGAGFRTISLLGEIEEQIGTPVVASDGAAYWSVLHTLGLRSTPGFGRLLATL